MNVFESLSHTLVGGIVLTESSTYFVKFTLFVLLVLCAYVHPASAQSSLPKPFVVQLSDTTTDYQQVFAGPPQTKSMHSGLVVLAPTKSVGKHSTKSYEEAIVVLSGSGEFKTTGGPTLHLTANSVVYCPPNKEHDVLNTGTSPLRYLYIAAKPSK